MMRRQRDNQHMKFSTIEHPFLEFTPSQLCLKNQDGRVEEYIREKFKSFECGCTTRP